MTNELWLIRHGETEWSRSGQHTSRTDLPLTEEGERRARDLKQTLGGKTFGLVLTSPMKRARVTCELAGYGAQAQTDSDLLEWNYGSYEGLTTPQIRVSNPDWSIWSETPPGGESAEEVGARVDRVIARCLALATNLNNNEPNADAALFAHGHLLRVLASRWLGQAPQGGRYYALSTGSISILGYEHETRVMQHWNKLPWKQTE